MKLPSWIALVVLTIATSSAMAEDGYDLWLRYRPLPSQVLNEYRQSVTELVPAAGPPASAGSATSATLEIAKSELLRGLGGLLGAIPPIECQPSRGGRV